jgi:ATP-dependent RNA helicase DDX51/DBP6
VERKSDVTGGAEVNSSTADSFVGKFTTPSELKEAFVLCPKETKPLILAYLIAKNNWKRILCFANTNEATHRLCVLLSSMGVLQVREITSKWSAHARDLVIKKFVEGSIDILVTSDQLARGIDIPLVDHVISYDVPGYTKTYIHRIGRTARAGREGQAITLVTKDQIGIFRRTIKNSGKSNVERLVVKNSELRPYEDKFKKALVELKSKVEEEAANEKSGRGRNRPNKRPAPSETVPNPEPEPIVVEAQPEEVVVKKKKKKKEKVEEV